MWESQFGQGAAPNFAELLLLEEPMDDATLVDAAIALATEWDGDGDDELTLVQEPYLPLDSQTGSSAEPTLAVDVGSIDLSEAAESPEASDAPDPTLEDDPLGWGVSDIRWSNLSKLRPAAKYGGLNDR